MKALLCGIMCFLVIAVAANARADVAGDVAAGLPLSQVITNALNAGLSIQAAVAQAIQAGADPVAVVTAAVAINPMRQQRL